MEKAEIGSHYQDMPKDRFDHESVQILSSEEHNFDHIYVLGHIGVSKQCSLTSKCS